VPAGVIAEELPESPGRRFKHRFILRSDASVKVLIEELRNGNQMFTTRVVDREAWYVPLIAPNGKSITWWMIWLGITGLFGLGFLSLELYEFAHLIHEGAGPQRSAFLSSFFTLVGTHGLHVTFGIVWLVTLMFQLGKHGLTAPNRRRVMCLSMFWHFLDVVWIGVFTFVYLMGTLK
jgi:hypothetical protein